MTTTTEPSPAQIRRWRMMPPWQAKRALDAWRRENRANGQMPIPAPTPAAEGPRQWTAEDVRNASPAETTAAMNAGLLRDLGVGPRRNSR